MRKIFILFFGTCLGFYSYGQGLDVGVGLGGTMYWGDLTPSNPTENYGNIRGAGQLMIRNTVNERMAFRGSLFFGKIAGDDALSSTQWMRERNLNFFSNVFEFSLGIEYDILRLARGNQWDFIELYLTAGGGLVSFNPKTIYQGNEITLQPLGTEGQGMVGFADPYSRIAGFIPFGAGIKIRLTDRLTLMPEFTVRYTFTDFLDDVSGRYVDDNLLRAGNGDLAANLANRTAEFLGQSEPVNVAGNPRGGPAKDLYYVGMVTLSYRFNDFFSFFNRGGGSDCYRF